MRVISDPDQRANRRALFVLLTKVPTFAVLVISFLKVPSGLTAGPAPENSPLLKQTYTYKTAGSCEIQADVYRPKGEETIRPVLLYIHGGALIFGSRDGIRGEQLERYLSRGYIVVSIDYRLAPETKLKRIIEDLRDACQWIRTRGPALFKADPERMGVIGHSAGGYLTLMAGFCVTPRPKALVSFYGYGDIVGNWYSRPDRYYSGFPRISREEAYRQVGGVPITQNTQGTDRQLFYRYLRQNGLWPQEVAGYDPKTQDESFAPFCPVRNVSSTYPPTLLLHGDQDTDVPFEQSVLMAKQLEKQGIRHQFIQVPGGGHGFDRAGNGLKDAAMGEIFDQVLLFLDRHLK